MQGWVPVPGSTKGSLALLALQEFGRHGFDQVNVVDLATRAGVTTGSLYHHFGSKLGLYSFVREEAERRMVDRLEGAAEASGDARAALLVAFDAAVRHGLAGLLKDPHPHRSDDPLEQVVARLVAGRVRVRLAMAAWREALGAVADGVPPSRVRTALAELIPDRRR